MYFTLFFAALTIATANAGLIGAPWAGAPLATSIIGTRTIAVGAPIGWGAPLIGKSIIGAPAIAAAPLGLGLGGVGLGAPLIGKSIIATPAVSSISLAAPALAAGPILKAW